MDTSDIILIEKIIECGSLTQASELLHMSQPTLSKKLSRLESKLSATLFYRSPTGLTPTDIASYIVDSAQPLKDQLQRIERHIQLLTQLETGELRLGVGPIIEQILLPEVLSWFVSKTVNTQISVITEDADTLLRLLRSAEVDVIAGPFHAGSYSDGDREKDFLAFPLISDSFVTVARKDHPHFIIDSGNTGDITQYPWAAPQMQGVVKSQLTVGRARQNIVSDNYALLIKIILTSDCISFGPKHIFREDLDSGRLRIIDGIPNFEWESACLVRPESIETPLVKNLVDLLITTSQKYQAKGAQ